MKLSFCQSIGFIPDFDCTVDVSVEWERGEPRLVVDDVLVDRHSLLRSDDRLMVNLALRVAEIAEDDEALLSEAVEQECGIVSPGPSAHERSLSDPARYV